MRFAPLRSDGLSRSGCWTASGAANRVGRRNARLRSVPVTFFPLAGPHPRSLRPQALAARWRIEAGRPPTVGRARCRPAAPVPRSGRAGRSRPSERAAACPPRKSGDAIPRADSGPRDPWRSDEPRWCMPRRGRPRHQLVVGAGAPAARASTASLFSTAVGAPPPTAAVSRIRARQRPQALTARGERATALSPERWGWGPSAVSKVGPRERKTRERARAKADFPAREATAAARYDRCARRRRP